MNSTAMLLETYPAADLTQREVVPCRTESGVSEYLAELHRVIALAAAAKNAGEEWEAITVRLTYGDVVHKAAVVA